MAVPHRISSPYEEMVTAVQDTATQANAGDVKFPGSIQSCFRYEGGAIVFECYMVLHQWKWRPGATKERVTIVLHAQELMSKDGAVLRKSTVRVTYFSVNE